MSALILEHETSSPEIEVEEAVDLIIQTAILGGLFRLLAEKLLLLGTSEEEK